MPFALVFIGLVLIVTGARGTMRELGAELKQDFTGPGNFTWWIVSIGIIGAIGYIDELKNFSRWFMTLIVLAMILSNKGFFERLIQAIKQGPVHINAPQSAIDMSLNAGTSAGGGLLGGLLKGAVGDIVGGLL